jgi:amino acid transporter
VARTSKHEPQRRQSPPKDDELTALVKLLTIVGLAIGIQQIVSPYFNVIMAATVALSATAVFVLAGIAVIRIRRRWHEEVSLRMWVIVVCIVVVGVIGVSTGFVFAHMFTAGTVPMVERL